MHEPVCRKQKFLWQFENDDHQNRISFLSTHHFIDEYLQKLFGPFSNQVFKPDRAVIAAFCAIRVYDAKEFNIVTNNAVLGKISALTVSYLWSKSLFATKPQNKCATFLTSVKCQAGLSCMFKRRVQNRRPHWWWPLLYHFYWKKYPRVWQLLHHHWLIEQLNATLNGRYISRIYFSNSAPTFLSE